MWRDSNTPDPVFTDSLELDLASVEPSLAGPKRPQDRVPLSGVAASADKALVDMGSGSSTPAEGCGYSTGPGPVVISAHHSSPKTPNPHVPARALLPAPHT